MKPNEIQIACDALEDLLDAEKSAVLNGNLDEVGRLLDQKSRLIEQIDGLGLSQPGPLEPLRIKLERNQNLLNSAADGVRSVARRLSMVRRVRDSLETYDARGQRKTVSLKHSTALEKKA